MIKRIIITVIGLVIVVGLLVVIKGMQFASMDAQSAQMQQPPGIVTTATVQEDSWETIIKAVGSLEAVQGVIITAELPGKVTKIGFEPGSQVAEGDMLLQQDVSSEVAQLRAAEASVKLAQITFNRSEKLLPDRAISQSDFDNADAALKQAEAKADTIRATIAKKTIRAPFAGRLGIRLVNLGQNLNDGQHIVSLQSLDPIYVNFLLPQQQLARIEPGQTVRVFTDAIPEKAIEGTITAINPDVDTATRNIRVQATLNNAEELLRPGMYASVEVVMPTRSDVLTIPATAVLYAPYSDSVFVVETKPAEGEAPPAMTVRQQFIRLGETRGDFVAVVSGLKKDDTVVSTGVFKLRNGQPVMVDNNLAPEFKLAPKPEQS